MKNLKRILSLALAGTMLVGMMVVGASAASFNDADEIQHTVAAETLAALKIMEGSTQLDGSVSFAPEGKLDRQAMAKMIAVIMNKGNAPLFADTPNPSFVDVKAGNWAVPYIEYCANFGYVNGYGNGYFGPTDELTPTAAARMLLNAMGYKWDGNGSWELATEVQARELGLYADLADDITGKAMSRDDAAQMIYNALNKPLADAQVTTSSVYALYQLVDEEGEDLKDPLFLGYFDSAAEATAYATGNGLETGDYTVTRTSVNTTETLSTKYLGLDTNPDFVVSNIRVNSNGTQEAGGFTTDIDLSQYMGHNVTVLSKNGEVYGVVSNATVLYTGLAKDITKKAANTKTLTIAGSSYGYDTDGDKVYTWNSSENVTVASNGGSVSGWYELTVIDNNGNGKVDMMVAKPVTVAQITMGKTTFSIGGLVSNEKQEDHNLADGLKTGEWVVATEDIYGVVTVEKAPVVEGVRYTREATNAYVIGGTTYRAANAVSLTLGETYDLVAYEGYIFNAKKSENSATSYDLSDVVYALQVASQTDANGKFTDTTYTIDVQILRQDNTKSVVTIDTVNGKELTNSKPEDLKADALYFLTTDEDGNLDMTSVTAADLELNDDVTVTNASEIENGRLDNTRIAEDAVIYVKLSGGEVKCLTGKTVAGWEVTDKSNAFDGTNSAVYTTTASDGFKYVALGVLLGGSDLTEWPDAAGSDTIFGYVTSTVSHEYLDKGDEVEKAGDYYRVTIWDGETETDYLYATAISYTPGDFVQFTVADGKLLKTITDLEVTPDAITGLNATEFATGNGVTGKIADAIIIYINDDDNEPGEETGLQRAVASLEEGVTYTYNVYTAKSGNTNILFVDVNNEIAVQPEPIPQISVPAEGADKLSDIAPKSGMFTLTEEDKQNIADIAEAWGEPAENLLIFAFETTKEQANTLTITTVDGTQVYSETTSSQAAGVHYFGLDVKASDKSGNWESDYATGLKTGTYVYEIKGADNTVYATGIFEFTAK